jgi:hypothetical protein
VIERRENGHAPVGTKVRVVTEGIDEAGHLFDLGAEGSVTGFQWGFAIVECPEDEAGTQFLNPDDYEIIAVDAPEAGVSDD